LAKLDAIDNESGISTLTFDDVTTLRRQLQDGQNLIRETLDRLRQSQEESEMNLRRRDEVETRLATLETEYEELLGMFETIAIICLGLSWNLELQKRRSTMRRLVTSMLLN
jgi:hypothetical protein